MLADNKKERDLVAISHNIKQTVNTSNIHTIELDPFVDCIYRFNISLMCTESFQMETEGKLVVKRRRCVHAMCMYYDDVWTCVCAHTVMTQRLRLFTDETQIAQKLNGKMIYNVAS